MSDHYATQLTIHECPPEQRAAALAVIEASDLGEQWGDHSPIDGEELLIGEQYVNDESSGDTPDVVAAGLIERAPGATFAIWADPKYEYAGQIVMYAPDLGRFDGKCDADGIPYITAHDLSTVLPDPPAGLRSLLGMAWEERIASLAEKVPA